MKKTIKVTNIRDSKHYKVSELNLKCSSDPQIKPDRNDPMVSKSSNVADNGLEDTNCSVHHDEDQSNVRDNSSRSEYGVLNCKCIFSRKRIFEQK